MELLDFLVRAFHFLFGKSHEAMYTAATLIVLNTILDFFRKYEPPKTKKDIFRSAVEKILAYMAFLILATRVDAMAVNALFGWEGSSQFLVCIYIVAREMRVILEYIRGRGIEIPGFLDARIGQLERYGSNTPEPPATTPVAKSAQGEESELTLDEKIEKLKQQIAEIERVRQTSTKESGEA
jgi:phage-related holin